MLIKAKVSFAGLVTMSKGETREVSEEVAADLLRAGYAVEVKSPKLAKNKKAGVSDEDVGGNS